jgi:four helix bundle protein
VEGWKNGRVEEWKGGNGRVEEWKNGKWENGKWKLKKISMDYRKNMIRGYMNLWVWQEAKALFKKAYEIYSKFPPELKRVASNQLAAIDSVHRNIAEGYCRKNKNEYLRFLDFAIASLSEFTSGNHVYYESALLTSKEFDSMDLIAFKIELKKTA